MQIMNKGLLGCLLFSSFNVLALPPVEVIHSCKNNQAPNNQTTLTPIMIPEDKETTEKGCDFYAESELDTVSYGLIVCNKQQYILINHKKYDLKTVQNHSINPSIKPGGYIQSPSPWSRIDFSGASYLCIDAPLSDSGHGASLDQYYIVEHAFDNKPIEIHYYFFDKDVTSYTQNK
jgi:hypothetical protein